MKADCIEPGCRRAAISIADAFCAVHAAPLPSPGEELFQEIEFLRRKIEHLRARHFGVGGRDPIPPAVDEAFSTFIEAAHQTGAAVRQAYGHEGKKA